MNSLVVSKGCACRLSAACPPSLALLTYRPIWPATGWEAGSVDRWEDRGQGHLLPSGALATLCGPWTYQRAALGGQQTSSDLAKASLVPMHRLLVTPPH